MGASLANKANGTTTSNPFTTGSLTWTAGTRGIIAVCAASSSAPGISAIAVAGGSETWTSVGGLTYADRRRVEVFLSNQTPSNGTLTITATVAGGTYQETEYIVDEIASFDSLGTPQTANALSGTSLSVPDLGTIGANDIAYLAAGFEAAADGFAGATGLTEHLKITGGANVRSMLVGYSATDDTPGATWTTSGNGCGMVGVIIAGTAAGDVTLTLDTPGAITLSGQSVAMLHTAAVSPGAITLAGQAITARITQPVTAGAISIAGQDVTLTAGGDLTLPVTAGAITLAGQPLAARITGALTAGAITLAGQAIAFVRDVLVAAGQITLSGQPVTLGATGTLDVRREFDIAAEPTYFDITAESVHFDMGPDVP